MTPLVVADITQGSGRYNASLGTVQMVSLIGAAVSTTISGIAAERVGFATTFIGLATVALMELACVWLLLPETAQEALREDWRTGPAAPSPLALREEAGEGSQFQAQCCRDESVTCCREDTVKLLRHSDRAATPPAKPRHTNSARPIATMAAGSARPMR